MFIIIVYVSPCLWQCYLHIAGVCEHHTVHPALAALLQ